MGNFSMTFCCATLGEGWRQALWKQAEAGAAQTSFCPQSTPACVCFCAPDIASIKKFPWSGQAHTADQLQLVILAAICGATSAFLTMLPTLLCPAMRSREDGLLDFVVSCAEKAAQRLCCVAASRPAWQPVWRW